MLKLLVAILCLAALASAAPTLPSGEYNSNGGLNWVLLIAGSNVYANYRHQADIYHFYQVVKKNGVPDTNIIVFHYDDIANNPLNPHQGIVINHPTILTNNYVGVPKDYTGFDVTAANILAVLAGNVSALDCQGFKQQPPTYCSKKVISSGPNDNVFVMYDGRGGVGILGMPDRDPPTPYLYGIDIIRVLESKATANAFHQLTFYIDAPESGSIFYNQLPSNISIYAVTCDDSQEWYCPQPPYPPPPVPPPYPPIPPEYNMCLGNRFTVAITEHADATDESTETLLAQYYYLRNRTSIGVFQWGQIDISSQMVSMFLGNGSKVHLYFEL